MKLSAFGICGKTHYWFKIYLKNRKQFCYDEGQESPTNRIVCGIPQGSCLGPLLFNIYMTDFECFECCLHVTVPNLHADDTSITCSSPDSASLLRNIEIEMANVADWMRQNRLSLNANKSEFMVIRHSRQHNNLEERTEIEVSQEKISRITKTKYLGLI